MKRTVAVALLTMSVALFIGCESSDSSENVWNGESSSSEQNTGNAASNENNKAIAGTWALTDANNATWYIHFNLDGSWKITDDAAGIEYRVSGTYEFDGIDFKGPMVNPNVGEGRIEGQINGDVITLDFVEYWHTPHKVVPYTGVKQ